MTTTEFNILSTLDKKLAAYGNGAVANIENPEECLTKLRKWLDHLVPFLEEAHSLPPILNDYDEREDLSYPPRLRQLLKEGYLPRSEYESLKAINFLSAKSVHPRGNARYFTPENASLAIDNARRVRDWLIRIYVEGAGASARSRPDSAAVGDVLPLIETAAAPSGPSRKLSIGGKPAIGVARQSFSHGRSKRVVVEKVKRRSVAEESETPATPAAVPSIETITPKSKKLSRTPTKSLSLKRPWLRAGRPTPEFLPRPLKARRRGEGEAAQRGGGI